VAKLRLQIYLVRQKVVPIKFFSSFFGTGLEFQVEILHTYVIITYVYIGINSIAIIVH